MKNITISEYGYIGYDQESADDHRFISNRNLSKKQFDELLEYRNQNAETEKVFTRVNPQCIQATSYVGIIQTKSLSIEILPKIYNNPANCPAVKNDYRHIFIEMIKPLLNINEIQINKASLSAALNKNIYELFITLFVEAIDTLIHKGIKSDYILQEGNQFFLKGKLKFNQHIEENYIHKERFYVETDEYLQDRVSNRLLKSTIALLLKKTNDFDNKRKLRQQLFIFDEVQLSNSHEVDFKKINYHRGMEHYDLPLRFAEVFLMHKSFTSLRGKDNVFALLFPMEKVFENYIEFVLNNSRDTLRISKVLANGYSGDYLLSGKMINQQPDFLLEMNNQTLIVTDAKWKLFDITENKTDEKINISSGDAYQIFSYLNYYNACKTAYIFAPKTDEFNEEKNLNEPLKYLVYKNIETDKCIKIIPVNLYDLVGKNNHILEKGILC